MDDAVRAADAAVHSFDDVIDFEPVEDCTLEDTLLQLELAANTCEPHSRSWRRDFAQTLCTFLFQLIERFELTGVAITSDPVDLGPIALNAVADLRSDQGDLVAEAASLCRDANRRVGLVEAARRARELVIDVTQYLDTASRVETGRRTHESVRRRRTGKRRSSMNPAYTESRRSVRVHPDDSEVLFDDPPSSDLMPLVDLSTDGALVDGKPVRSVGRRVRLVLLFPQWQPVLVEGRVTRCCGNGHPGFAVGFERVPDKTRRLLSDTVTTELKRQLRREQPAALVVDGSKTVCRFVCDTLNEFGAAAYAEGTVLEAVNRLVRGKRRIRAVFVGNPVGSSNAFEFARFVSTQFPDVRLVLLVERTSRREPSPPIRREGRVVTLLDKPWTPARLASFLMPGAWSGET